MALQHGSSAETIAGALRDDIRRGVFRHGQQLPSTRQLAERWGTSVATVPRAAQMLADEGLIEVRDRSSRLVNYPAGAEAPKRVEDLDTPALADLVQRSVAELARRAGGSTTS